MTLLPAHIAVVDAAILTLTGKFGFTVIVMPVLVAGFPVAQGVAFEVNITVTTCPLIRLEVVNKLLFVPAFVPFTCH